MENELNTNDLSAIIEGILFLSGDKGVSIGEMILVTKSNELQVKEVLDFLNDKYLNDSSSGLQLIQTSNTYKLVTKNIYYEQMKSFALLDEKNKISSTALEVLAIIAYSQPITRYDIEELKGTNVSNYLTLLKNKSIIEISGKSNSPGKPNLYSTTDDFLDYIGINSLNELPKLQEFELNNKEKYSKSLFNDNDLNYKELSNVLLNDENTIVIKNLDEDILKEIDEINDIDISLNMNSEDNND